jgi:hypothetical protein
VTAVHPQLTGHPGSTTACSSPPIRTSSPTPTCCSPPCRTASPRPAGRPAARPSSRSSTSGADFRLADPAAWTRYYPTPHAGHWTYGLPELPGAREAIRARHGGRARLLRHRVDPGPRPAAGRGPGRSGRHRDRRRLRHLRGGPLAPADLLGSEIMGSMSAYKVGGTHRHTPEIEQALSAERAEVGLSRPVTLSFTPTLAPMPRGILATCTARLASRVTAARRELRASCRRWPRPTPASRSSTCCRRAVARHRRHLGSNAAHLQVAADRTPAGPSSSAPSTTSARARPARPCRSPTSCSACRKRPA